MNEPFSEFLKDLDTWYEYKNKYLVICKAMDEYFGGLDKVPGDLGKFELAYETAVEELTQIEVNLFDKWYNKS